MATVPAVTGSSLCVGAADACVLGAAVPAAEPEVRVRLRGATATMQLPTVTSDSEAFTICAKVVFDVQFTVVWLSLACTCMLFESTSATNPEAPGRRWSPALCPPLVPLP